MEVTHFAQIVSRAKAEGKPIRLKFKDDELGASGARYLNGQMMMRDRITVKNRTERKHLERINDNGGKWPPRARREAKVILGRKLDIFNFQAQLLATIEQAELCDS